MNLPHRAILEELYPEILETLEPTRITPQLLAEKYINADEYEVIGKKETRSERLVEFVEIIKSKPSITCLIQPLKNKGYKTLASEISGRLNLTFPEAPNSQEIEQARKSELIKHFKHIYQDFAEVRLIPGNPRSNVCLKDVWVNLIMKDGARKKPEENYKLCLDLAKSTRLPIIVQGEPGGGKSTLVKKICLDWSNGLIPQFKFVLMAKLRDVLEADNLFDICEKWMATNCPELRDRDTSQMLETYLKVLQDTSHNDVLLILDGLDEAVTACPDLKQLEKTEFFRSDYPVIITTRPYKVFDVHCNHKICLIQGLDLKQQLEFVDKYFDAQYLPQERRQAFIESLKDSKDLQEALGTPLLLQLSLISGYTAENYRQTDLFKELISSLIQTYNEKHPTATFKHTEEADWINSEPVYQLGSLAFSKLVEGEEGILNFTEADLQEYKIDPVFINLGILTAEENPAVIRRGKPQTVYSFLHKTVQEFFAATALALSLETFDAVMAVEENRLETFKNWPSAAMDPKLLAEAGFLYSGEEVLVWCAFCYGAMHKNNPTECPVIAHHRLFPDCPFIQQKLKVVEARKSTKFETFKNWVHSFVPGYAATAAEDLGPCTVSCLSPTDNPTNFVDISLFQLFHVKIWNRAMKDSWKKGGLTQFYYFLTGIMSDKRNMKWINQSLLLNRGNTGLFHNFQKLCTECPVFNFDIFSDSWTSYTFYILAHPRWLQKSKYSKQLYHGIFEYDQPEKELHIASCVLQDMGTITESQFKDIKTAISSFSQFSLSGSEQQLMTFSSLLADVDIDVLKISIRSDETAGSLVSIWPTFRNVDSLIIDISLGEWSQCCIDLLHLTPRIVSFSILGHGGTFRDHTFEIVTPELLRALHVYNMDFGSSESSFQQLFNIVKSCPNLTTLDLRNSKLATALLLPLLQSLRKGGSLQMLFLDWNKGIGKDVISLQSCCDELQYFPHLELLSLEGCGLSVTSLHVLKSLLSHSESLHDIRLARNRLSEKETWELEDVARKRNIKIRGVESFKG